MSPRQEEEIDRRCKSGVENEALDAMHKLPIEKVLEPPTLLARYTCASILIAVFAIWGNYTFVRESRAPGVAAEMHDYKFPLMFTMGYLVSIPALRLVTRKYLSKDVDEKLLLTETMILYNTGQVLLNAWMVYRFIHALAFRGHPIVGDFHTVSTGATYAIWVHYCDKYLEFFDTYFMILRGKMDQVSFLHVYHHTTIVWAWWIGLTLYPGGDSYFGALLNSCIHVMMYSYYALSLLKIRCPWKKYLTQAQLLQFTTVLLYTIFSVSLLPKGTDWRIYCGALVQSLEMISLFAFFVHFYKKAYGEKKTSKGDDVVYHESHSAPDSMVEQISISSVSTTGMEDKSEQEN